MTTIHLVACANNPSEVPTPSKLWSGLARAIPRPLAAVAVPGRVEMLVIDDHADEHLGALSRLLPGWTLCLAAARAANAVDVLAVPVRSGLVEDPLLWPWSTLRDVVGAVTHPWVTADRLGTALGVRADGVPAWLTLALGVPGIAEATLDRRDVPGASLPDIGAAVASASRASIDQLQRPGPARDLFFHLAWRSGWSASTYLARLSCTRLEAIPTIASRKVDSDAAWRCLHDPRLLVWNPDERPISESVMPIRIRTFEIPRVSVS